MFYKNLFYFDIETVPEYRNIDLLQHNDNRGYLLFKKKYDSSPWLQEKNQLIDYAYLNNAGTFSTFGKIVCISFGYYNDKVPQGYSVFSIYGDDEQDILKQFQSIIDKVSKRHMILCGYRIKSFDIPYIVHKFNKYNIEPPKLLDIYSKKPWEIPAFDLADEWKQQFKYYVSLDEVAYELGVDSSKDDMDGSMVCKVYWEDNDLIRIKNYCEKDVLTTLRIAEKMLKFKIV
jgi:DNA polymerase elongation subunit (family B)